MGNKFEVKIGGNVLTSHDTITEARESLKAVNDRRSVASLEDGFTAYIQCPYFPDAFTPRPSNKYRR